MVQRYASSFLTLLSVVILLSPARADKVDDVVKAEMARQRIPGVSVAIVQSGRVAKSRGYGLANMEHRVPVKPNTLFQIQSVTKSFTAAGILMLVEEGKLGLDDPLGRYLDGVPETWKDVTIRRLLSHTSGLKDYINEPTQSLRLDVTDEEVLKAAADRPLNFTPGARYQYSNTNYLLLGMVIRKLTGQPYDAFLAERIFKPLKMISTRVYSWSDLIPGRAAGYLPAGEGWRNGEFIAPTVLSYPGGGILSTAPDLAKWNIALSAGKILSEQSRCLMWTPATMNDGSVGHYGFGWDMGSIGAHPTQSHTGSHGSGFASAVLRLPKDELSIVVLTNLGGADAFGIARRIAETCLEPQ